MLAMIPPVVRGVCQEDLERIKSITREAYPTVSQLSTEVLSEWMQGSGVVSLFVVDVRAPAEFAVSHLHGAVNLQTVEQICRAITTRNATKTVLYCSVGFRSSRLAHLVTQRSVLNVANLEGSIFQWANEGKEIYQGEERVRQVHPYSRRWRGLLNQGLAADC
jgi:rhodanese-related sulfurtransferase